jgi:CubicO group peptidase (beta-lactamase class C family)
MAPALALCLAVPTGINPGHADDLTADLEAFRTQYELPAVAAAVVKDGNQVAIGATGVRALGTDVKVTTEDRFHLGSDTKAMTATLAGMLVEQGKLTWTTTVGEILGPPLKAAGLPTLKPEFSAITLEQLLSHTSGIPSDTEELYTLYVGTSEYDMSMAARRLAIIADWGSKNTPKVPEPNPFQYANLGYMTAGAMVETAAGEPWESLITRRIFDALQLKTAGLGPQVTPGRLDAASGHLVDDDGKVTRCRGDLEPMCRPRWDPPARPICRSGISPPGAHGTQGRPSADPRSSSLRRWHGCIQRGSRWRSPIQNLVPRSQENMPPAGAS